MTTKNHIIFYKSTHLHLLVMFILLSSIQKGITENDNVSLWYRWQPVIEAPFLLSIDKGECNT